jgi:hypothetical protein
VHPLDKVTIVEVQTAIRHRRPDIFALIDPDYYAISRNRYFHIVIDLGSRVTLICRRR